MVMSITVDNKSETIKKAIKDLPYFAIDSLMPIERNKNYLRVLIYRYSKRGTIEQLKKGIYVSKEYLEKINRTNAINEYSEFIGTVIYKPSYISLEYVLDKNGILTESINALTLVCDKKTNKIYNFIGAYKYYKVKDDLFTGFKIIKKSNFMIAEATLAKALFDYLYLRKYILNTKKQFEELRLNLDNFSKNDYREFEKYVKLEKTKKMKEIYRYLIEAK